MNSINFKKEVASQVEPVISQVTDLLKSEGFGVLTRIDLHAKIKEKLGKDIPACVILGACNPQFGYDAYSTNPDVASLLPCNIVVRDLGGGRVSVEVAKPSAIFKILGDNRLASSASKADVLLKRVVDRIEPVLLAAPR